VLPLHLFRQQTFVITSAVGWIVGFALFGSVTYFPLYLQVVKGVSPTGSGMQMVPMMGGMLVASITSGQLISRTGRYKIFPLLGTAVMTVGLFLLSRLTPATSNAVASLLMLVLGIGLGMVMQVLVIAVQNDVEYRDLGVATSGATLFRLIGGSLGTAILGAVFAGRLSANLARVMPAGMSSSAAARNMSVQALLQLPPTARVAYAQAFTSALDTVFLVATIVCGIAFFLTWFLPERPLRATVAAAAGEAGNEAGEAFGRPADEDAVAAQIYAALSSLADRDVQRQHIVRIVERAGETLSPLAAWLLVQIERHPDYDPYELARNRAIPSERVTGALDELRGRRLITHTGASVGPREKLTASGCEIHDRLVSARRAHLSELAAEWDPATGANVSDYLRNAVRDLIPDARRAS
jgi:DNA-binding MarR family transcriptional regulator